MKKDIKPIEAYVKDKIKTNTMDINYTHGQKFGIENATFNFTAEPIKEPYGDVVFTTGYDKDSRYTSTFLMTAQEAMDLGKMLIDTALESMTTKRIIQEAEACDAKLSFLVLKGLIDTIKIQRLADKLKNYEPPYYKYRISAYKDNEKLFSYDVVYNLSYFTTENQIDYWKDKMTDKERVKLIFENWNPYTELEERRETQQKKALESLSKMNLKPMPIEK